MVDARAVYDYGERSSGEAHGVVLTKPHVVRLILDLAGYTIDRDLTRMRLLEPSCGHGAFLLEAIPRLMAAAGGRYEALADCIRAYDIDAEHVRIARSAVTNRLVELGAAQLKAAELARTWIERADYLLTPLPVGFDCIVGNPPYVRIEQIPPRLQAEYRARYTSIFDRADLYVAFIERSLQLLSAQGVLSFICADRWILNRYGARLRALLAEQYRVLCYVDAHHASPFESEVIAYPSIFAFTRGQTSDVRVATLREASADACAELSLQLRAAAPTEHVAVHETWFSADEPWVVSSPEQRAVLRRLEQQLAPITATAKVGIGVATGNDKVYIVTDAIDIEPDRLVPLVMREDIEDGRLRAGGNSVINTFGPDGKLIDLMLYPKLRRYFEAHAPEIKRRHIALRNPSAWFRTIDRVYPELARTPKLLIPDIAGANEVVFEAGHYHPHHNLYFVTSESWDLEVLGGLLSSRVALFFVWSYAVKMRGGYLRFQAQYLRRIRLPDPQTLDARLARALKRAFQKRDFVALDALALRAYGLDTLPDFDFVDTRSRA